MDKISSFKIDHDVHFPGFYTSSVNGDVFTYDLRFKTPNGGDYLPQAALHTVEHLFATVIRNSDVKADVIYFGPMGCRTGFYLLLRGIERDEALAQTIAAIETCLSLGEIPGASRKECGNYLEHDLDGAKRELDAYLSVLKSL